MKKTAVLSVKVDKELKDAFIAAVEASDRNASHVIREFMRAFIAERLPAKKDPKFMHPLDQLWPGIGEPDSGEISVSMENEVLEFDVFSEW